MAKARDTSTDRLSNVIEVVELGRRTGLLGAERGSGASFEEGEIYFVGGQAIYAVVAHLRGREALAALGQWGGCRFSFDTEAPRPAPNLAPVTAPVGGFPQRGGMSPSPQRGTSSPRGTASGFGWSTPGGVPAQPPAPSSAPEPGPSSGVWGSSWPGTGTGPRTGPLARKPRRSPDVRDLMAVVSNYNLSRSHRTILLLADGSHNVLDLARLASKSVDEVTQLLAELEARALIYYYE